MADWDPFFDVDVDVRPPTPEAPSGHSRIPNSTFLKPPPAWLAYVEPLTRLLNPPRPFPTSLLGTGPVPAARSLSFATVHFDKPCLISLGPIVCASIDDQSTPYTMTKVEEFETGHLDRVTVLHINFDGTLILTASIDHRIKVWERHAQTGQRRLVDTWTAHGADIRDAKWFHPTTGTHIASIGNDLRFRLWTEDRTNPPNSGRRFQLACEMHSSSRVPFVSLDLKTIDSVYIYLVLIDRQGLLSFYEPSNIDDLKEWSLMDQFHVCQPPPGRGEETSFKVRFDPNLTPLSYVNNLSQERYMVSLVATAMNEVKIYRTVKNTLTDTIVSPAKPYLLYEAARLPMHPALIRDVQWAPFNARGTDFFATACRDGSVRIYEMELSAWPDRNTTATRTERPSQPSNPSRFARLAYRPGPPQQSILSSEIANRTGSRNPSNPTSSFRFSDQAKKAFSFQQSITQIADLQTVHRDAWALAWDPNGQVLMSNGADGITKLWKRSIMGDEWLLFSDQAIDLGDLEDSDDEMLMMRDVARERDRPAAREAAVATATAAAAQTVTTNEAADDFSDKENSRPA